MKELSKLMRKVRRQFGKWDSPTNSSGNQSMIMICRN